MAATQEYLKRLDMVAEVFVDLTGRTFGARAKWMDSAQTESFSGLLNNADAPLDAWATIPD
jgi:hypothetical protein